MPTFHAVLDSNVTIAFERSLNYYSRGNADDWAKGFTGGLYQATITTTEPFTFGWNFKVKISQ